MIQRLWTLNEPYNHNINHMKLDYSLKLHVRMGWRTSIKIAGENHMI